MSRKRFFDQQKLVSWLERLCCLLRRRLQQQSAQCHPSLAICWNIDSQHPVHEPNEMAKLFYLLDYRDISSRSTNIISPGAISDRRRTVGGLPSWKILEASLLCLYCDHVQALYSFLTAQLGAFNVHCYDNSGRGWFVHGSFCVFVYLVVQ